MRRLLVIGGKLLLLPVRWLGVLVHVAVWRLRVRFAPHAQVHGLLLSDLDPNSARVDPDLIAKLDEALQIIECYAPRRYERLKQDVPRILFRRMPGLQGSNWHFVNAIVLDDEFVRNRGNASIALTLVHEATHARLERAGVRYKPWLRTRIERVCTRAEIAFAERVPGSDNALARLERALAKSGPTNQQLGRYAIDEAEAAGAPAFVLRMMKWRYGLKS